MASGQDQDQGLTSLGGGGAMCTAACYWSVSVASRLVKLKLNIGLTKISLTPKLSVDNKECTSGTGP